MGMKTWIKRALCSNCSVLTSKKMLLKRLKQSYTDWFLQYVLWLTENELCSDVYYFRNDVEIDRFTEMTDQYCLYSERTHSCNQVLKRSTTGFSDTFHTCICGVAAHRLTSWINIFLLFFPISCQACCCCHYLTFDQTAWFEELTFHHCSLTISKPYILKHFHIAHTAFTLSNKIHEKSKTAIKSMPSACFCHLAHVSTCSWISCCYTRHGQTMAQGP